jgi:hypothetical protein
MFGRNKRSETDLVVSVNQRNIKKKGRHSTAKRRSEIPTSISCKMLFPIVKNRNKKVLYKANSWISSALIQDNQHFLVAGFYPNPHQGK